MKTPQSEQGKQSSPGGATVRWLVAAFSCIALLAAPSVLVLGQGRGPQQQRELLASVPKGLPGDLLMQVQALGDRMRTPGKEETVLIGQLFDAAGNPKDVRIVHELSGMVRIEGLRENIPLIFDGDFPRGIVNRLDDSMLETFVMDTVEGMIYSARSGGAMRLLGRRFGPDPRAVRDYRGPWYDIFEVIAPVRSRQDRQIRLRLYYFDSDSRLLLSTRYTDTSVSPGLKVETRFSDWRQVEGSNYPGRIERYENDQRAFTLITAAASGRSQRDAFNFR
jgi:hypothetical protein